MPTIEIDQDIYDHLNEQGRTEDTFSDVLRRKLALPLKPMSKRVPQLAGHLLELAQVSAPRGPRKDAPRLSDVSSVADNRLHAILDRYLPPHWSDTAERQRQILMVVENTLGESGNVAIAERELKARKEVAEKLGVNPNTVLDKYGRQLYGTGSPQVQRFRAALTRIEKDYKSS